MNNQECSWPGSSFILVIFLLLKEPCGQGEVYKFYSDKKLKHKQWVDIFKVQGLCHNKDVNG
jgi:hypothetical protein